MELSLLILLVGICFFSSFWKFDEDRLILLEILTKILNFVVLILHDSGILTKVLKNVKEGEYSSLYENVEILGPLINIKVYYFILK